MVAIGGAPGRSPMSAPVTLDENFLLPIGKGGLGGGFSPTLDLQLQSNIDDSAADPTTTTWEDGGSPTFSGVGCEFTSNYIQVAYASKLNFGNQSWQCQFKFTTTTSNEKYMYCTAPDDGSTGAVFYIYDGYIGFSLINTSVSEYLEFQDYDQTLNDGSSYAIVYQFQYLGNGYMYFNYAVNGNWLTDAEYYWFSVDAMNNAAVGADSDGTLSSTDLITIGLLAVGTGNSG